MGAVWDKFKRIHGRGKTVEQLAAERKQAARDARDLERFEEDYRNRLAEEKRRRREDALRAQAVTRRAPPPPFDRMFDRPRQVSVPGYYFGRAEDAHVRLDAAAARTIGGGADRLIRLRVVTRHGGLFHVPVPAADLPKVLARAAETRAA